MKHLRIGLLGASLFACCFANATITITAGPGNVFGDENVLFNQAGLLTSGTTVQGDTNQTNSIVDFTSTTSLSTPAQGQARITAASGTYQDLDIKFDNPLLTATSIILNVNAATSGSISFTVDQLFGGPVTGSFNLDKNGENFFMIVASNGERITDASFTTDATVADVRQVRIGGAAAVPEPASMFALGSGLFVFIKRRRSRA